MSECPPIEKLQLLLDDQLSAAEERTLSAHVDVCGRCQEQLEQLASAADLPGGQQPPCLDPVAATVGMQRRLQKMPPVPRQGDGELIPQSPEHWPQVKGYQILGQLGRGGMGVVYKARQQGLNRLVALKMILQGAHAAAEQLARFRREAEAIARLQHPHIVQIHEIGEQDGQPFFSMEFAAGGSLAGQLDGTPLNSRMAAALVETLARAVHAAHEQGIIHRDLKPANILLQRKSEIRNPRSESGSSGSSSDFEFRISDFEPKVSDFGLAKPFAQPTTQAAKTKPAEYTPSGAIVGSPSYMAPEQAQAKSAAIGPPADVYGLGAILYELLTGRPPFKAETALDTVLQVLHEEPVPPRRLQAKLPRDLETICLTCLRKDPYRRYASALALAEDLHRFQAREPIQARSTGIVERALKWSRRRPALAALLVVSAAACTLLGIEDQRYKARLLQAVDWATAQQKRADANLQLAREAVDKTITKVTGNPRLKEADFHQLRHELLEYLVPFYQEFAKQQENDPVLAVERGRAYGRLGLLRREMGETQQAIAEYEQMQAIFAQLVAEFPTAPEYRQELANSRHNLGLQRRHLGERSAAEAAIRDALQMRAQLAAEFPDVPQYRRDLANSHTSLASLFSHLGRYKDAEASYRDALKIQAELAAAFPNVPGDREQLGSSQNNLANLLSHTGRLREAEQAYREALTLYHRLVADFPTVPEYRQQLAGNHNNLAVLLISAGRASEAERAFGDAVRLYERLAADFPAVPVYRRQLAASHNNLGNVVTHLGRPSEAEQAFRNAIRLYKQLAAEFPTVPVYRYELATSYNNLGGLFAGRDQPKQAEPFFREALGLMKQLAADFPSVPDYRLLLARSYNLLGVALAGMADTKEAAVTYREAIAVHKQLAADFPNVPIYHSELAMSYSNLGGLLASTGQRKEAEAAFHEALAIDKKLADQYPNVPEYRQEVAKSHQNLGTLLAETGQPKEAEAAFRDALALREDLADKFPHMPEYHDELAHTMMKLAGCLRDHQEFSQARQLLEGAASHSRVALQADANHPTYRQTLQKNLLMLAPILAAEGNHNRASQVAEQLAALGWKSAEDAYQAACALAQCVPIVQQKAKLPEAKGQELARSYTDRALAMLRQAIGKGYKDAVHMKEDRDLDPLRSYPEFQKLLEELEQK